VTNENDVLKIEQEYSSETWDLAINLASVISRRLEAVGQGYQFDGARDMYKVLGYKRSPESQDYVNKFLRQDIAGRIVGLHPKYTWKRDPILIDGDVRSDETETGGSAFITQWKELSKRLKLTHKFQRLDRLARIGRYGVLLIGVGDGQDLAASIERVSSPEALLYVSPKSELQATVLELEQDSQSERYDLPILYQLARSADGSNLGRGVSTKVHYSRVLHVVEDPLDNEVYGAPTLERMLNRLDDLEKVVGGGSEAFWLNIRRGLAVIARDGNSLPAKGTDQYTAMRDEIDQYAHGLRRLMTLMGVDVQELGADIVDPSGIFGVLVSLLAASADIPQRILLGSERGELASSQDAENWAAIIRDRQVNFAESSIVRPFVDWCVEHGALIEPKNNYEIEWPAVVELGEMSKAERAEKLANAVHTYTQALILGGDLIMPPDVFAERYLDFVLPEDIDDLLNREDRILQQFEPKREPEPEPPPQPEIPTEEPSDVE